MQEKYKFFSKLPCASSTTNSRQLLPQVGPAGKASAK
jgi:hypothetical protein